MFEQDVFTKLDITIYNSFRNNYSTTYTPIDQKYISQHDLNVHSRRYTMSSFREELEKSPQLIIQNSNASTIDPSVIEAAFNHELWNSYNNNYSTTYIRISMIYQNHGDQHDQHQSSNQHHIYDSSPDYRNTEKTRKEKEQAEEVAKILE